MNERELIRIIFKILKRANLRELKIIYQFVANFVP